MVTYNYHTPASDYLMPTPKSIETSDGTVKLHLGSAYCIEKEFASLSPLLESQLGLNDGCEDVLLEKSPTPMAEEAYSLKVTKEQVVMKASTVHGMFNAVQTLRQLHLAGEGLIPCCRIEDEPSYAWRGFMLDTSRHFFSVQEIEKLIDVAAMHHLNVFHWHLTDDQGWRFPVDGYPKLEEIASKRTLLNYTDGRTYGGFYSRKDIREVVSYAGQRMVTVVPEMECPGHASALLAAYPEMGCAGGPYHVRDQWGIFPEVMCPGKQKVFDFLAAAIKSLSELFPSPYIHIGGDECPHSAWEQCPDCQKIMKENGFKTSDALQGWFTGKVAALVHQAGKTCIGWDEVFEFARKGDLPDDFIVMSWRGEKGGREALKAGYRVIMSPNTEGLYLDYKHVDAEVEPGNLGVSTIKEIAAYDPVKGMDEQEKQRVLGAQGNLWTEKVTSGRLAEYMLYPRLAVLAERLWSGKSENLEERLSSEYKKLEKMDIACYRGRIE